MKCQLKNKLQNLRKLIKRKVSDRKIAEFCIYHANCMKAEILKQLSGQIPNVRMNYIEIEKFFPRLRDKLIDNLLTVVALSWDSQLEVCSSCPVRCISEKDRPAAMFDDPFYGKIN